MAYMGFAYFMTVNISVVQENQYLRNVSNWRFSSHSVEKYINPQNRNNWIWWQNSDLYNIQIQTLSHLVQSVLQYC